jgi:hypothetical protein
VRHDQSDPLIEVNRRLSGIASPSAEWREWLPSVLPSSRELYSLPLAARAAIGARIEGAVEPIRPGSSDLSARLEFLERYGQTLRLEPLPNEWVILAKRGNRQVSTWLRITAPPPEHVHQAFSGASAQEVRNVINAVPAGMRSWLITDVVNALTAVHKLTSKNLASVAREFSDAGDLASVKALVDEFPDHLVGLAGWAAAAGDDSNLTFLLNQLSEDAQENVLEEYLRVIHASRQKCRPITAEMVVANVASGRR